MNLLIWLKISLVNTAQLRQRVCSSCSWFIKLTWKDDSESQTRICRAISFLLSCYHERKKATFFLRCFHFPSSWFTKSINIFVSICLSIYMYDSLHNAVIKKNLCETQLRFEGQKSALNTCAQIFIYEHF